LALKQGYKNRILDCCSNKLCCYYYWHNL